MSYTIKHMGLGGILDQAIALTRNHFGLLFSIVLILVVPIQLVMGYVNQLNSPEIPLGSSFEKIMEAHANHEGDPMLSLLSAVLSLAYSCVLAPLTNASVISAIARLYLGQPVTVADALRHGARRLLPVLWVSFIVGFAVMFGLLLFVIPGILFMIWFSLSHHVVVIEEIGGTKALGRSKKLVSPNWMTMVALGLIVGVIWCALWLTAYFVPQPQVSLLVASLLTAVMTVVATSAWVVYYFSCRCAVENFDLHYLAEQIGEPAPAVEGEPVPGRATV